MIDLHANATRLLAYLYDNAPDLPDREGHDDLTEALATGMPLSHATTREVFEKICSSGALLSQKELVRREVIKARPDSAETRLGTDDYVFFFAGPFCFPQTSCGFLFRAIIESALERAEASPFDSGGLLEVFSWNEKGLEQERDFLDRHRLPVPRYRDYLRELLSLYFEDPWHYIDGTDPVLHPIGIAGGDRRRWTVEVRVTSLLTLEAKLEALFVTRDAINHPEVENLVVDCEATGIPVLRMKTQKQGEFRQLEEYCIRHFERVFGGPR